MRDYLRVKQPMLATTFSNALLNNRLGHAYLLKGEAGTPLKEIAIFLAQSLVCDYPEGLACENCWNCLRIADGNYADFTLIDGETAAIKKEAVQSLESDFGKTGIEPKGILIYVIHLVENMTDEAVNALLKFLEEPSQDVYAILTTENEARVLPTIISRSQVLSVLLEPRSQVIKEALALEVPAPDAELLSYFYNEPNLIKEHLEDELYLEVKELLLALLEALTRNQSEALFLLQNRIAPAFRTKETARYFLDLLSDMLLNAINLRAGNQSLIPSYDKILTALYEKKPHLDNLVIETMKLRSALDLNLNIALAFDHLGYLLSKESTSL